MESKDILEKNINKILITISWRPQSSWPQSAGVRNKADTQTIGTSSMVVMMIDMKDVRLAFLKVSEQVETILVECIFSSVLWPGCLKCNDRNVIKED